MIRLTFYICFCYFNVVLAESIEVQTTLGPVRGKLVYDETTGVSYNSFEGIPYAEPPVGDLRFKPPVPKQPWDTVLDATKPAPVCPQIELYHSRSEMNEDCLYLNIYTPVNSSNELLPVMFFIHDGGFDSRSGNAEPIFGPQLLIKSEMVVVSFNYRLGALGFLALCNEQVSGNAGLKDIVLALKIVHENIIKFGGDPNSITLKGIGAGSVAIQLLMITDQTDGLFQKVMLHSSSFLNPNYMQIKPRENAMLLAQELRLGFANESDMLEELKRVDAFDIVDAQEAISRNDTKRGFRTFKPFLPTVEMESESAIITRPPLKLMEEGAIRDVPMLIGLNDQEGLGIFPLLKREPDLIERLNENFDLAIPVDIEYPQGSEERNNLVTQIRDFYFDGGDIDIVNVQNYLNLISDSYIFTLDYFIELYISKVQSPVYYALVAYDTEANWFKDFENLTYPGASHNDDLGYMFLTSDIKPKYQQLDANTISLQDNFVQLLKQFMTYGVPSSSFPEAGQDRRHVTMYNYNVTTVNHRPLPERIGFWKAVYEKYLNSQYNVAKYFCTNDNIRLDQ